MFKRFFLPPLVLTLICAAVSGLLAAAYDLTYVDETGVMTDKLLSACEDAAGKGDYTIMLKEGTDKKEPVTFGYEGVNAVITDNERGVCLIELTEDGYSTEGLHFVVGLDSEGTVTGISFVSNKETPGLGSKVTESEYLEKYKNADSKDTVESIDNVTSATYSSKGLKRGIAKALEIFDEHKGEILK